MSKPAADSLLHAVCDVARLISGVTMRWFRSEISVDVKLDGSPVTIADREGELAAREWIEKRFPTDGILGEEFGHVRPDAQRQWILDPIDGTKAFIRGVPLWGSLVACCEGEKVLAGAACYPAVDEIIAAAPGEGCWWNGSRASVSAVDALGSAMLLTTDNRFPVRESRKRSFDMLAEQCAVSRAWGDCYGYLLVATGRAEIMVDDIVNPWDVAALQPIIEEAGGVFTSWSGTSSAFGGDAIATNAALAIEVRRILGGAS